MQHYPKINSIYRRDMALKGAPVIVGEYAQPEFAYLADNIWVWSEKVDGTSICVGRTGNGFSYGGHTDNAQIPAFLWARLYDIFEGEGMEERYLNQFGTDTDEADITLFGEGYGARIGKGGGKYKADGVDFVLFDVQVGDWWLKREDVEDVARNLGLDAVPIIGEGTLEQATELCRAGFKSQWGDFMAEGLVLRPKVELKTRAGHRIITKLKHKDFIHVQGGANVGAEI